jgi:hypothetical protein
MPERGRPSATVKRCFGTLQGQFVVPNNFDAPLPPSVLAAFEGAEEA